MHLKLIEIFKKMSPIVIFIYAFLSIIIFINSLRNRHQLIHGFSYALAVNVFPWMFLPYQAMDESRASGIPIAYFPIIAAGLPFFLTVKLPHKLKKIVYYSVLFIIYISCTSFFPPFIPTTIIYFFSWIFNLMLFFCVYSFYSIASYNTIEKGLKVFIVMLGVACLVGLLRVGFNINGDSNFMPYVNRNGTVLFLVMTSPILFDMRQRKKVSLLFFAVSYILYTLCLVFMTSRSGQIGFILVTLLFYGSINPKKMIIGVFGLLFLGLIFYTIGGDSFNKLTSAWVTLTKLTENGEIGANQPDYKRFMLIQSCFEIIRNNFWFGTGIGLPNYQHAFAKYIDFYGKDSKPHLFYISYFAELGLIGFTILLIILRQIYTLLPKMSSNRKGYRVCFIGVAFMMLMNEYILLPELWYFFGMLAGISNNINLELQK